MFCFYVQSIYFLPRGLENLPKLSTYQVIIPQQPSTQITRFSKKNRKGKQGSSAKLPCLEAGQGKNTGFLCAQGETGH